MKAIVCEQLGICENQITKNQGNLEISLSFASPKSQVIPSNGLITF
jgi:hypothetical protein